MDLPTNSKLFYSNNITQDSLPHLPPHIPPGPVPHLPLLHKRGLSNKPDIEQPTSSHVAVSPLKRFPLTPHIPLLSQRSFKEEFPVNKIMVSQPPPAPWLTHMSTTPLNLYINHSPLAYGSIQESRPTRGSFCGSFCGNKSFSNTLEKY